MLFSNYLKTNVAVSLLVRVIHQAERNNWVLSPDLWLSGLKTNHFTSLMMDIALMVCLQSAAYVYDAIKMQRNTQLNTTYFVFKIFAMGKHFVSAKPWTRFPA